MTAGGADAPVVLGRVSGLFGVKGWVKVFSYTDPRAAVLNYREWLVRHEGDWRAMQVAEGKPHGKTIVARFADVDDRDSAAAYVDSDIAVPRTSMPEPDEGSYYWSDLEGLEVRHRDGRPLGTVAYVMETGANDVLVTDGDEEQLIPFVIDEVILDVDRDKGVIIIDWEWN